IRRADVLGDVPARSARAGRTHHEAIQHLARDRRAALPLPASRDGETDSVSAATGPSDKNSKAITLAGEAAIVTGGGRGFGRAIALGLAAVGAGVTVTARSKGQLDETAAMIERAGGR